LVGRDLPELWSFILTNQRKKEDIWRRCVESGQPEDAGWGKGIDKSKYVITSAKSRGVGGREGQGAFGQGGKRGCWVWWGEKKRTRYGGK